LPGVAPPQTFAPPTAPSTEQRLPPLAQQSLITQTGLMWKGGLAFAAIIGVVGMYYYVGKRPHDGRARYEVVPPIVGTRQVDVTDGAPTAPFARASSVLAPQLGNRYGAENVLDGKLDTAWVEGVPGPGIGEWLDVEFPRPTPISQIEIFPGYGKNQQIFEKNNRPKTIQLQFMDDHLQFRTGNSKTIHLEDAARWQTYPLAAPIQTPGVRFVIVEVYRGTTYDDTAISEVRFR
jgi:hypothetical protein